MPLFGARNVATNQDIYEEEGREREESQMGFKGKANLI